MRNGLLAGPLPAKLNLPFASEIERACAVAPTFSPILAYAIKVNETGLSDDPAEIQIGADPATLCMPDGSPCGVGIFQATSYHPPGWQEPYVAALEAVRIWLYPAEEFWAGTFGMQGADLVRAVAAEYNAGRGNAEAGHRAGDVGIYTTFSDGVSYSDRCLGHYNRLQKGVTP